MTLVYKITGMTCSGCESRVKKLLSRVAGVKDVVIDREKENALISMDRHILTSELTNALKDHPKYLLSENGYQEFNVVAEQANSISWFVTYKPIFFVFSYIIGVTLLLELLDGNFNLMGWMQHFMGGFFLVFSFFKMLDLRGFADSYAGYDILAKNWRAWGFIYAFLELFLGIAFLTGLYPFVVNAVTFIVMSVSIIGVLKAVLNKRKIRCACLGAVFNLPMSTITIVEDALMIAMSLFMLIHFFG